MSIHDTTLKNSNDGQVMQKIPMVSGLLDRHGCPIPDIEGINPLRFHSRHPVWGEHALAVEKSKDTKVGSFFCMYCEKELVGNATEAIRHMKKGCKIPLHTLKNLLEEVDQYKERAEQLRRAHKDSKTKGRKVRKANDDLAIQKRDAVEIAELVLELSQSKKYGPLDDTTGVMAMIQTLLMQAQIHLSYGIEIIEIAGYFEMASRIALHHLDHISENVIFSSTDRESLVSTCMAVLSMNSYELALANVAVEAVLEVADTEKKEVRLELIQVKGRIGRTQSVELVHGIVIDKHISHKQMPKRIEGAKIAFLSFEPSNINTVETSRILHEEQHKYVEEMIRKCEDIGATLVICQWRFDEEVSQLLMQRKLTAVSGVSDAELKEIANATGGHIVQKIQDLSLDKLGEAKLFREKKIGKTKGRVLYIESYASPTPVTIFFHAGSNIILEEKMRNLADALRVLRSLITDNSFVCGGGSAEISCSLALDAAADTYPGYARPFLKSFAHALDAIPLSVAENSGLLPFDTLTMLKSRHIKENNAYFGIDCNRHGIYNMKEQHVFASLSGKKKQILLALKVMRTVLKADEVT
ncbi:T-complex protein 1 subunit epsilon-like isoform X2 [Lolium rigidum]|nr:T-complex protein 1 subunit epsilon-like isoform X2 [Lolium rigidum]